MFTESAQAPPAVEYPPLIENELLAAGGLVDTEGVLVGDTGGVLLGVTLVLGVPDIGGDVGGGGGGGGFAYAVLGTPSYSPTTPVTVGNAGNGGNNVTSGPNGSAGNKGEVKITEFIT